jgi:hypothetical protein
MGRVEHYLRAMAEGAAEGINDKIREEIDQMGLDSALSRKQAHVESAGAGLGAGAIRWSREEAARQSPGYEQRREDLDSGYAAARGVRWADGRDW